MPRRTLVKLQINGEEKEWPEGLSIAELLRRLELLQSPVAVEVNEAVVRRAHHHEHVLQPGDKIEIVTFVGGG